MSDATGNVGAGGRDLAVGDRQCRAGGRFAATRLGYNRNMPEPVIGRLGKGRRRGRAGNSARKTYGSDASEAHESNPKHVCDQRVIWTNCV